MISSVVGGSLVTSQPMLAFLFFFLDVPSSSHIQFTSVKRK